MMATKDRVEKDLETEILRCIVDAMLEAEIELNEASGDQWQKILVDSCRRRKSRVAQRTRRPRHSASA